MNEPRPEYARATAWCTWCPRLCHFACPTAHGEASEAATAWGLMTLVENGFGSREGVASGSLDRLWACASCQRCTAFCVHDNPVAEVIADVRGALASRGAAPAPIVAMAHTFDTAGAPDLVPARLLEVAAEAGTAVARVVWMPQCGHAGDETSMFEQTLTLLAAVAEQPVRVAWNDDVACCGDVARRAGYPDRAAATLQRLVARIGDADLVLTDCADAVSRLTEAQRVPVRHVMEWLAERRDVLRAYAPDGRVATTVHGGCRERRVHDVSEAESLVLDAAGVDAEPAFAIDGIQECCGGEAVYAAVSPAGAERAGTALVAGARRAPESTLTTSAARCARHLSGCGEPVRSVLELVVERCIRPS